ncbi:MAG: hypothetical protein ABI036_07050 [Fibrobacteria bacterium]
MCFRTFTFVLPLLWTLGWSGTSFTMAPWILIFEPQKKSISQVVDFKYVIDAPVGNGKVQGPNPNTEKSEPKPIEITISAREINLEGGVIYPSTEGADDFVVYPSQFILYPGDVKKIQVQWVGTKLPNKEVTFGFISTQLPLNIEEREKPKTAVARVEMVTRYEGVIVVRPPNVQPMVVVDTAYYHNDSTGSHFVAILNNKGTGLQSLSNIEFGIAPMDKSGRIKLNERIQVRNKPSAATAQSLIAGFRRKVEMPWPPGFPIGPVNATVSFQEAPKE